MKIIVKDKVKHLRVDLDLYNEIRKFHRVNRIQIQDHELVGKRILDSRLSKQGTIQTVYKQWFCGWYIVLFADFKLNIDWLNISSIHPKIIQSIDISQKRFSMI